MGSSFNTQKGELEQRSWCEYVQSTNVVTIDECCCEYVRTPLVKPRAFEYGRGMAPNYRILGSNDRGRRRIKQGNDGPISFCGWAGKGLKLHVVPQWCWSGLASAPMVRTNTTQRTMGLGHPDLEAHHQILIKVSLSSPIPRCKRRWFILLFQRTHFGF